MVCVRVIGSTATVGVVVLIVVVGGRFFSVVNGGVSFGVARCAGAEGV